MHAWVCSCCTLQDPRCIACSCWLNTSMIPAHLIRMAQDKMLNSSTSRPPRQDAATGALQISLLISMFSSL